MFLGFRCGSWAALGRPALAGVLGPGWAWAGLSWGALGAPCPAEPGVPLDSRGPGWPPELLQREWDLPGGHRSGAEPAAHFKGASLHGNKLDRQRAAGGWCLETNAVLFCRGHCILVLESDTHQDIESHKIHRCSETPPVARETDTRGDSQGRGADLGSFLWIREETWSSEAPPGGCDRHSPLSALTGSCGFIFLLLSRTHTQSLDVSPAGGLPPRSPRTARPHLPPTRLSQVVWKSEAGGCASGCSCVWGVGCVCVCVRARVWWACVADVFNPLSF